MLNINSMAALNPVKAALMCLNISGPSSLTQSRVTAALKAAAMTESRPADDQDTQDSLYVHMYSSGEETLLREAVITRPPLGRLLHCTSLIYASATSLVPHLDVTVLHRYNSSHHKNTLSQAVELLILQENQSEKLQSILADYYNVKPDTKVLTYRECDTSSTAYEEDVSSLSTICDKTYDQSALGGTFDTIHNGHKVLLYTSIALTNKELTIGVTDQTMNKKKKLCELISPVEDRKSQVRAVCEKIRPDLSYNIVTITDPFGPTITDESLQCIIVSEETRKGGDAINTKRQEKGYADMVSVCVPLVEDSLRSSHQEEKVSSSTLRESKLGQLLRQPEPRPVLPNRPYLVGLTGGIASGKTSIGKRLEKLGAGVVCSDLIAHETYKRGCDAYNQIVDTFGKQILNLKTGEIERRRLGEIVFSDKAMLEKLNGIVWPATAKLVEERISELNQQGKEVCFIEAALLLEAGWQERLHEVWACIIPEQEAIQRLMDRNSLSEEEAHKRVSSQSGNQYRVDRSNVVLSTLWDYEVTQKQVEKAWKFLCDRIGKRVCFIESALLLEAGRKEKLHEVWACIIPEQEAIQRIMDRNGLSEEEAHKRVSSQSGNQYRVYRSNVVLSTLWDYEVTQKQVEKAWKLLCDRIGEQSQV